MKASLKHVGLYAISLSVLLGCSSEPKNPQVSESEALARLEFLERLDEKEYAKNRVRDGEEYEIARSRRLDYLADQKIALQNEKIHYQNQAIKYQTTRQATKDAINDYGDILMKEAEAINKANENKSKKKDTYIQQRGLFVY